MSYGYKWVDSTVGALKLVANDGRLAAVLWADDRPGRVPLGDLHEDGDRPVLMETQRQLEEYFAGQRQVFDLDLDFAGTDFQRRVWKALLTIPYGQTRSYGAIALQIGHPSAVRAVGAANGRNPISIIAPGFAGGLAAKERLLALERGTTIGEGATTKQAPEQGLKRGFERAPEQAAARSTPPAHGPSAPAPAHGRIQRRLRTGPSAPPLVST
jgi:methylated-DNA-[protein]-cysteine S-methyltransferase